MTGGVQGRDGARRGAANVDKDHRSRVAAQRREKMRGRLMEAALIVFAQKGVDAGAIDEVTSVAGVSRGTFYNYFRTAEELLIAVAVEAGNEIAAAVMALFESPPDPAVRAAVGIRHWLALAREHKHLAAFFRRAGMMVLDQTLAARAETRRYLPIGVEQRRFNLENPELAFDLIGGAVLAGINTLATVGAPNGYAEELAERVLIALGLPPAEAREIAFAPLPAIALAEGSLIQRSARKIEQMRNIS